MDNPFLKIQITSKKFDRNEVLSDVELEVSKGEVVAIMGSSGSGKTTLARCLAGFENFEGKIEMEGNDITHLHPRLRAIGIVPQDGALFPHMNVEKNIGFGIKDKKNKKRKIDELLSLVELSGVESIRTKKIDELSGGQQQRVAVARALSSEPKVIILDESFTSLDQWLRVTVRKQILESIKKTGTTVLVITHDIDEAFELGDRVAVIDEGRIIQIGSSKELYATPINLNVAKLVGIANVINYEEKVFGSEFIDFSSNSDGSVIAKFLMARPENIASAVDHPKLTKHKAEVIDTKISGPKITTQLKLESDGQWVLSTNKEFSTCSPGDFVEVVFLPDCILY